MNGFFDENAVGLGVKYTLYIPAISTCLSGVFFMLYMAKYAVTFGQENIRYQTPVA